MQEYLFLYKAMNHRYYSIEDFSASNLRFLVDFFSTDYRSYDTDLFHHKINLYNVNFVYNDIENKFFYIGCSLWELDEDFEQPSSEYFPMYVNDTNSCKISHDNFIKLATQLTTIKNNEIPFALIYRDKQDWIDCKGFATQETMELFVKMN